MPAKICFVIGRPLRQTGLFLAQGRSFIPARKLLEFKRLGMGVSPIFYLRNKTYMDVRTLLENTLPGLGYELVDVELMRNGGLRVFIDQPNGITLDDCVSVSNHLTRLFAVEDVDYDRLEVSSPGLDRPLKKEADFVRFVGERARIKTRLPLETRKNFIGVLKGVAGDKVEIEVDGKVFSIPFSSIDKARLDPEF